MGYANPAQTAGGLHLRQYSRAFIISDKVTEKPIVFVSTDSCMQSQGLKLEVYTTFIYTQIKGTAHRYIYRHHTDTCTDITQIHVQTSHRYIYRDHTDTCTDITDTYTDITQIQVQRSYRYMYRYYTDTWISHRHIYRHHTDTCTNIT